VSAADVAVIFVPPADNVAGAVYVMAVSLDVEFVESVPHSAAGQDTAHVMPLLIGS
jgi:hypothetical protein